jgi:hypothetical protein
MKITSQKEGNKFEQFILDFMYNVFQLSSLSNQNT